MRLTQEKFWADNSLKNSKEHNEYTWMIPIAFCTASNPKISVGERLMEEKSITITLPNVKSDEWVKV
jgi:hypothetical protein